MKDRHTDDEGDRVVIPIRSGLEFPFCVLDSFRNIQPVEVDHSFLSTLAPTTRRVSMTIGTSTHGLPRTWFFNLKIILAAFLFKSFISLSCALASCLCSLSATQSPLLRALLARSRASNISRVLRLAFSRNSLAFLLRSAFETVSSAPGSDTTSGKGLRERGAAHV